MCFNSIRDLRNKIDLRHAKDIRMFQSKVKSWDQGLDHAAAVLDTGCIVAQTVEGHFGVWHSL
jgi:hypothetical protein